MELYKIENLTFKYPDAKEYALSGVSLSIKKGEFLTICGQSGCGKSTLLRLMKPILSPSGERGGVVLFENEEVSRLDLKAQSEKIGFVMQNPEAQIVTDKVWHELAFGLESLGLKNNEIRARVSEMAAFFGIEGWFHKKTETLSGGQKQLLNLASVMVMQPSVLILDEPTSQLDPIAAQEFLDVLAKINRELGVTVILSEHRLEEALSISDMIAVMDKGDIIFCGAPKNAAGILKKKKHPMLDAMSTAMRVFSETENGDESPVTVREGREWLSNYRGEEQIQKIASKETEDNREVLLSLEELYFRYEKNSPDVIKALSTKIYKGELYAILGGNGSGKTTLLSLISGINTPQRGKITFFDEKAKAGVLPQNPQTLFIGKTVREDLLEVLCGSKLSKEEQERRVNEALSLCELTELSERHPYDLSGGEMQRAALAKILMQMPDILLLDEPTKGMDAHFKKKFASILKTLQKSGVTIIMVSHDVEFCARYAQRCAMFFDGAIVSENTSREFFCGKSFYTTAANRMSRGIIGNAVTTEDIIYALGGKIAENEDKTTESELYTAKAFTEEEEKPKSIKKYISAVTLAIISIASAFYFKDKFADWRMYALQLFVFVSLGFAINIIMPQKELDEKYSKHRIKEKKKLQKHTVLSIMAVLVLIPLTILAGCYLLGDRRYYFISLMIILEIMVPFFLSFEKRKVNAREIVVISVLCAITVAGRAAFFMLPMFKPVLALIIICAASLGAETAFLVGAISAFSSNIFFGQGPWTPWQMFAYGIVGFVAGVLINKGVLKKSRISLCIYGMISVVLLCGGILNVGSLLMYMPHPKGGALISTLLLGLPLDILHGASTVFFLYTCAPAMIEKIERIKHKFGIFKSS